MSNETKFWESVGSTLSGGWLIHSTESNDPDLMSKMRTHDVRIYAIDVSTGWMSAGATTQDGMNEIRNAVQGRLSDLTASQMMTAASAMVHHCAKEAKDDKDRRDEAMAAAVSSLTLTRTFEVVKQQGGLAGHWLMLVYQGKDKSLISRPMYMRASEAGVFLAPHDIKQAVKAVLKTDLTAKQSGVYAIIQKSGGLMVADCYQDQDLLKESSTELRDLMEQVMRAKRTP